MTPSVDIGYVYMYMYVENNIFGNFFFSFDKFLNYYCLIITSFLMIMLYVQVRPRFCKDPLFDTITEEAERVRLFKEYIKTVKVGMCVCVFSDIYIQKLLCYIQVFTVLYFLCMIPLQK